MRLASQKLFGWANQYFTLSLYQIYIYMQFQMEFTFVTSKKSQEITQPMWLDYANSQ